MFYEAVPSFLLVLSSEILLDTSPKRRSEITLLIAFSTVLKDNSFSLKPVTIHEF